MEQTKLIVVVTEQSGEEDVVIEGISKVVDKLHLLDVETHLLQADRERFNSDSFIKETQEVFGLSTSKLVDELVFTEDIAYVLSTETSDDVISTELLNGEELMEKIHDSLLDELVDVTTQATNLTQQLHILKLLQAPNQPTEEEITAEVDNYLLTTMLKDVKGEAARNFLNNNFLLLKSAKKLQGTINSTTNAELSIEDVLHINSEEDLIAAIVSNTKHE